MTRYSETCTCQAGFTAEGDNGDRLEAALATWRARHKCTTNPHAASAFGTGGAQAELGFRPRETWTPTVPVEPDEERQR